MDQIKLEYENFQMLFEKQLIIDDDEINQVQEMDCGNE
jgi:hypothetical protein